MNKEDTCILHFESTVNPNQVLHQPWGPSPCLFGVVAVGPPPQVSMLSLGVNDKATTFLAGCNLLSGILMSTFLISLGHLLHDSSLIRVQNGCCKSLTITHHEVRKGEVKGNREVPGAFSDIMYNKVNTIWSFPREQEGIFLRGSWNGDQSLTLLFPCSHFPDMSRYQRVSSSLFNFPFSLPKHPRYLNVWWWRMWLVLHVLEEICAEGQPDVI